MAPVYSVLIVIQNTEQVEKPTPQQHYNHGLAKISIRELFYCSQCVASERGKERQAADVALCVQRVSCVLSSTAPTLHDTQGCTILCCWSLCTLLIRVCDWLPAVLLKPVIQHFNPNQFLAPIGWLMPPAYGSSENTY